MTALPTYQIRIAGRVDETTLASFACLTVIPGDEATAIIGQFDQAALHGMLEMIRALGLDLLEARQIDASPPMDDPGATDHGQHGVVRPDRGRRPR
jgi:hypothetical protein